MCNCFKIGSKMDLWNWVIFLRPKKDCNPLLLSQLIRSQKIRVQLEQISKGVTMSNLNNKAVGMIKISLPEIKVQESVLNRIDELENSILQLKLSSDRKLNLVMELHNSLLTNVFKAAA